MLSDVKFVVPVSSGESESTKVIPAHKFVLAISERKLELLLATPRATLSHLSCSPNFPRASYLDERTLTNEPIVTCKLESLIKGPVSWYGKHGRTSVEAEGVQFTFSDPRD